MRIALLSDPHVTRGREAEQPRYRGRFEQVITDANAARVALVLMAGDLTEHGAADEVEDFKALTAGLQAPWICVPGNHDGGDKHRPGGVSTVTAERVAAYEAAFGLSYFT